MQVGAQAGSAIGSLFGQKGESIDKEAVGGLGDLRELAKAGYNVDDALKQRAGFERAAAERGFEFDTKAAAAVGAAGPGDGNNTGARDAGIAALLAVAVPVIGPIAASIFAIARVVERNGNSMQKQHPDQ